MDSLEAFGKVVRRERKRANLTQLQLADLAGIHKNYVGLIERGKTAPALDTIFAISIGLGLQSAQLLEATQALLLVSPKKGPKSS